MEGEGGSNMGPSDGRSVIEGPRGGGQGREGGKE